MQFRERNVGRYGIYASAVAATDRDAFIAALVIKIRRQSGLDEVEVYRDLSLSEQFFWSDETIAVQHAVQLGRQIIRKYPERLVMNKGKVAVIEQPPTESAMQPGRLRC